MPSSNRIIRGLEAAELPSWKVDLIGKHYASPVDRVMSEINRQVKTLPAEAPPPTPEMLALMEWEDALKRREAQLELLERDTLKQAEERGLQNGYEAGWNTAHQERVALIQATQSIEEEFERFKTGLADKLLDLAVLVSKKVLADTMNAQPEQAALLLNQVLETMQLHGKAISLKAHPDTLRTIQAQYGDQQALGNIRLIEDSGQLPGGFVLQHPEGEVDGTLQTRWLRAIETLGRNQPLQADDLEPPADKPADQGTPE